MINGTYVVPRVPVESTCRSSKDYRFTDVGIYKIHSDALMPNIPFDKAKEVNTAIDSSIFINNKKTKPLFKKLIKKQNYITCQFIGRAPLEWYNDKEYTKMGRKFILRCENGNPNERYRVFGTEAAIRGYNKSAADNSMMPGGGE